MTLQECVTTGEPLGTLESGLAASLSGSVRAAVVSGGALCLVGAAAVAVALPLMWRYDSREHLAEADAASAAGTARSLTGISAQVNRAGHAVADP